MATVLVVKLKKCRCCDKSFRPYKTTDIACSYRCYQKLKPKTQEQRPDSYEALKSKARQAFQRWIKKRDAHQPCISCGTKTGVFEAGHYLKAELFTGLIFHEDNCHKQCIDCNNRLQGNPEEYKIGLIERIGIDRVLALEELKNTNRFRKYTKEEFQEIIKNYK